MNVAPIIFLCFFIFFTAVSVKVRKQQEAAQRARRENEKEAAQNQTVQAAQRAGSRPAQPQTQPKTATQTQVKAKPGPRPAPAKETVRPKVSTVSATAVNEAKNGRYAIPVKAECRQQIGGLIHDQSSSGQTVFIEPAAVVELGNEYKRLLAEEKQEIERILAGLTAMIVPYADELYNSLNLLAKIDCIFSRAVMARDMSAYCPRLNDRNLIHIKNGRHPLIDRKTVVPISVWIGEDFSTLIITGPNTGGKTVTLKTVGLFTLMASSGMFLPADEFSDIAVFDQVCADIGDEQSIEQSLSTFSAHMTNIVEDFSKVVNY